MKKLKKRNGIVLAGIMALSLIGCANSNNETPAEAPDCQQNRNISYFRKNYDNRTYSTVYLICIL